MKKKTMIAIIAAVLLILAVCVCTLPFPTHFEYTFYGAKIDTDGSIAAEGDITLAGTRYSYLLKSPQIQLTSITLPGFEIVSMDYKVPMFTKATPGYERIVADFYVTDTHRFEILNCYLAVDLQTCVLTVGPHTFAGSTDPDFDPNALLKYIEN